MLARLGNDRRQHDGFLFLLHFLHDMLIGKPVCMTIQADFWVWCKALLKVISMHEPVLSSDFDYPSACFAVTGGLFWSWSGQPWFRMSLHIYLWIGFVHPEFDPESTSWLLLLSASDTS